MLLNWGNYLFKEKKNQLHKFPLLKKENEIQTQTPQDLILPFLLCLQVGIVTELKATPLKSCL